MKRRIALRAVMFLLVAMASGLPARAETVCRVVPGDDATVADTVRTMYAAAKADDLTLFHSVAASGFYAFDNGSRFDGDALMNLIIKFHAAGYAWVWTVNEPRVQPDCNTATITYVNKGSITSPKGTQEQSWLESALLEKQAGRWKIRFFHSTRVPAPDAH